MRRPSRLEPCGQCGLPVALRPGADPGGGVFCCFGCALLNRIAGTRAQREEPAWLLARLGLALFLTMNVMAFSLVLYAGDAAAGGGGADALALSMAGVVRYTLLLFSAPVMALLGWPILQSGIRQIRAGSPGADALIAIGAAAAFGLSAWATLAGRGAVYYETACGVLVLVTAGRYLEAHARTRAAGALRGTLEAEAAGSTAAVVREGRIEPIAVEAIRPGDLVRVAAGASVPVDGTVEEGEAGVDESSLTGEPLPVRKGPGSPVHAGTACAEGALLVRVTSVGAERLAARIARILEEARAARAPIQRAADRAAALFVPLATAAAAATFLVWTRRQGAGAGVMNGLAVLLIACPCALGLATPLAFWRALALAARRGIVIGSGDALQRLAAIRTVFLDKTGTLTEATPLVERVEPAGGVTPDDLVGAAAALESWSDHPLARAVLEEAARRGLPAARARRVRPSPGAGIEGEVSVGGAPFVHAAVGGESLMRRLGATVPAAAEPEGPAAFVAVEGRIAGRILFRERVRAGVPEAVGALRRLGLHVEILTGDGRAWARALGRELGVPVRAAMAPAEKGAAVARAERESGPCAMVGEGLNDAPALGRAGVSFALGCGDRIARDASDVALLRDDLTDLPWLVLLARRTMRTVRAILFWAFAYNLLLIPLAMAGRLQPVLAALAMTASSLIVAGAAARLGGDDAPSRDGADRARAAALRTAETTT